MRRMFFFIAIVLSVSNAYTQSCYNCQWRFGYFAGLDFSSGNPIAITNSGLAGDEAFASIADSNGNLLFYCNAMKIYNSQNQLMENGDSLYGYPFINNVFASTSTQGCLILPLPDSTNKYYVFIQRPGAVTDSSLSYSIVDLTFNGGLGKTIQKNIPLLDNALSEKMIAIKHGNGRDWWILVHEFGTAQFIKFLLTPFSIQGPFYQNIGSIYNNCFAGQLASNKSGNKIVSSVLNDGKIDLFDFDRCSGNLSNYIQLADNFQPNSYEVLLYGCCFSPNGNFIYVGRLNDINQYDIRPGHITDPPVLIWDNQSVFSDTFYCSVGQFQLGADNKIYVTFELFPIVGNDSIYDHYLHVINQPDSLGLACDFQIEGVYLEGKTTLGSLPNMPNYNLSALDESECDSLGLGIDNGKLIMENVIVRIYPNPANDELTIEVLNGVKPKEIEISNALGVTVMKLKQTKPNQQVNIKSLASGVYFVKVQMQDGGVTVRKFVKE